MTSRNAATVAAYLRGLPEERRGVVSAVRRLIRRHLPAGYREVARWGMICYEVPLGRYPETYNGQPLCYAGLAAQKNYYALYLMGVYQDPQQEKRLREAFRKAGKKLDMGRSCIRFRELEDLPLDAIGTIVARTPLAAFIARYEAIRRTPTKRPRQAPDHS